MKKSLKEISPRQTRNIQHKYQCDNCGDPATICIEERYHKFEIESDGMMNEIDYWGGEETEYFCDSCYEDR